jgi:transcription antitermination factor NusG
MSWYALYTKSRNEKKLAERLEAKGFEVYAPTQTVYKQWSDRKKKVSEILFKSYVFAKFDLEKDKITVLQTAGAVAVVNWLGKPAAIRDQEINAIRDFLNEYKDVSVEGLDFNKGDALKITNGKLQDEYGTVVRQTKHKVILQLEKIGMSLQAEIPKSQVEKLKN